MSKKMKTLLITAGCILLVTVCILSVTLYAKHEINKEKFIVPAEEMKPAVELMKNPAEIVEYSEGIYSACFTDETSVTKTVSIDIPDESIKNINTDTKFNESDLALLTYFKGQYLNYLDGLYSEYENVSGSKVKSVRPYEIDISDYNDAVMTEGTTDESGNVIDTDYYYFNVSLNGLDYPVTDKTYSNLYDTYGIKENIHILDDFKGKITDISVITDEHLEIKSGSITGKVNKYRNQLEYICFSHTYNCSFTIQFINEYEKLDIIELYFDYVVNEEYTFTWYGAYLLSEHMYLNPGDMESIPANINVEGSDYKLTFTSSDKSKVTVDSEGLVTAVGVTGKNPVKITMCLEYKGRKYTGVCYVTVTDLTITETEAD